MSRPTTAAPSPSWLRRRGRCWRRRGLLGWPRWPDRSATRRTPRCSCCRWFAWWASKPAREVVPVGFGAVRLGGGELPARLRLIGRLLEESPERPRRVVRAVRLVSVVPGVPDDADRGHEPQDRERAHGM